MKKTLITLTLAAAGFVALAAPASAHTPSVYATCGQAAPQVIVNLTQYEPGTTVTIQDVTYPVGTADFVKQVSLGDPTKSHVWTVTVDNKGDGFKESDEFDQTFTDTVEACQTPVPTTVPLEDKDLTPVVPPKVEYVNPAWPICMVPGKHLFNAHDAECVTDTVVMAPPAVLERAPQPPVLAFTGSTATTRAIQGSAIFAIGLSLLYIGRRWTA